MGKASVSFNIATVNGLGCKHCGSRKGGNLVGVDHDVTPHCEPRVTFVFACPECTKITYVDMDDCGDFLSRKEYWEHGYK